MEQHEESQGHLAAPGGEVPSAASDDALRPVAGAAPTGQEAPSSEFKRDIRFTAAYDKRNADPRKNYGIHGVECTFSVSKDGRGITFVLFTNWMLPHVQAETDARDPGQGRVRYMFHKPQPAGVDWHDSRPHYEGQSECSKNCSITGGVCYSDGSGLLADEYYRTLLEKGSDGVFERLERQYAEWLTPEAA